MKSLWTVYSKMRNSVFGGHEALPCKFIRFEVTDRIGAHESGNLSRSCMTEVSGSVEECDFTSGCFSISEAIAKKRACDRDGGRYEKLSGGGMVRVLPVKSIAEQEGVSRGKDRYYRNRSSKSLLKGFFELNPLIHLDLSHPTTSFSADQMIQFERAVGLEVSLASYGKLGDLLLKARVGGGGGDQPVALRYSLGKSLFPSVSGSSWGDSVASRTNYLLPTVTKTDASNVVVVEGSLQEACYIKQADAPLVARHASSEKPGPDSFKTLQEIRCSEKKKQLKMWKWSKKSL